MSTITRRSFLAMAAALGATAAWGTPLGTKSHIAWQERRDLFPEGVASGDPDSNSVLLWTCRPPTAEHLDLKSNVLRLNVEVAEDEAFTRVVATAAAPVSAASDWTCRVLVGGLKPSRVFWYRFTDPEVLAVVWAGRSPRPRLTTRGLFFLFLSVARMRTMGPRTPTAE
jgi:alkaline phosphatase D